MPALHREHHSVCYVNHSRAQGVSIERWDCLRSTKGGKRGDTSMGVYDVNPCFCPYDGYCKNITSGILLYVCIGMGVFRGSSSL